MDGGINGPVVHRGHLTRLFAIHDTAWTQQGVIQGLLHLYKRSEQDYWLDQAILLADAQAARNQSDGSFRWAGHEDDRFSSLVHNAMADVALLDMAEVLCENGDRKRAESYIVTAEENLQNYIIGRLYRAELGGFAMNPVDYYLGRDRFVVNMNSIAIEALGKLDERRNTDTHFDLIRKVGARILALQAQNGECSGSFPYADWEPDVHVPLYTALTLRGYRQLLRVTGDEIWIDSARRVLNFLERVRCSQTGFWPHKLVGDRVFPYPFFAAGAGMTANGILDASELIGRPANTVTLIEPFLRNQHGNGAIINFIGYQSSNRDRLEEQPSAVWEDTYPTPSWNAQAFLFLSQVLPPPTLPAVAGRQHCHAVRASHVYWESASVSVVLGLWPPMNTVLAVYVKRWRYGFVLPGMWILVMSFKKLLMNYSVFRRVVAWLRYRIVNADRQ